MIRNGKAGDGKMANKGNERGTREGMIHWTCTAIVRPTSEQTREMKEGEVVQDHQVKGLTQL